jgi:hypothetical protein
MIFGVQNEKSSSSLQGESSGGRTISAAAASSSSKPKPDRVGRERLQHFAAEISTAHEAIEDLEQRVARFGEIVVEADGAQRALQDAINADGGRSLAKYSAGQTKPDEAIVKLVSHAKSSSEAAAVAKTAMPHTESLLEDARSQLVSLGEQKYAELNRVMAMLADKDARAYQASFAETCKLHDKLVGYANVAQANIGDVQLIVDTPRTPRFALPTLGNSDADPFLRHRTSELTVNESTKRWSAVRSRLESNVDADLSDLI